MTHRLRSHRHAHTVVLLSCCSLVTACAYSAHPSRAGEPPGTTPADTAVFSAVVRFLRSSLDRPLYVDPRPIRDAATSWEPSGGAMAGIFARIVESRRTVLQRLRIPGADAAADLNCATGNMRAADPEEERRRERCNQRQPSVTIAVSMPSSDLPAGFHREAYSTHPDANFRRLRVLQMSVAPRYGSHSAYDYVVLENRDRTWTVVWKVLVAAAD